MEVGIVDRTGADHQVLEVVEDPIVVVEERDVAVVADAVRRRLGRDHDVGLAQVQPPEGRELRHVRDVRGRGAQGARVGTRPKAASGSMSVRTVSTCTT